MRDLNQKLKRWGLGILAGSILLSSSVSSFAQSPADPKKFYVMFFLWLKQALTLRACMICTRRMSTVRFLKLCLPMII